MRSWEPILDFQIQVITIPLWVPLQDFITRQILMCLSVPWPDIQIMEGRTTRL